MKFEVTINFLSIYERKNIDAIYFGRKVGLLCELLKAIFRIAAEKIPDSSIP